MMKYYEVCPSCGGNPEMDEDGNYYTCFACCDTGAVAVEETYEETISRELNEAFEEYAIEGRSAVTHRFIFENEVFEVCRVDSDSLTPMWQANQYFNPKRMGLGNWVLSDNPDIYEYRWVYHDFCGEQNDY